MVGREAMNNLMAIGVGCRSNCPRAVIAELVSRTLEAWPANLARPLVRVLFTIEDKRGEAGVGEAAEALGIELVFLSRAALQDAMPRTRTRSVPAQQRFGVASVAEAAALAGGGPNAVLIVPRISANDATCAIAADLSSSMDHQP
jgi:cobalamin biosynthesis protein CbiG